MSINLKSRANSFRHAISGLKQLWQSEPNIRIHLLLFILAIISGLFLKLNLSEWMLVIIVSALVFAAEAINTAIEKLCDLVEPNINSKIKFIKDVSAAAVLITALAAIAIGVILFVPKIWRLMF